MKIVVPVQLLQQATPVTPPAGVIDLYAKSDNYLYVQDSTGTETGLMSRAMSFFLGG